MNQITIGILAHVDAGKTTLSEGLLYESGCLRKLGRVDRKDAFLDTDEMERDRGITIFSKQARMQWGDYQITLLDTPGHVDFGTEMERTLQVLDYAILVISGADGVQSHTRTLWRLLERYDIPVFVFVNKMDREGTSKEALMDELKTALGDECVDLTDPEAEETKEELAMRDEEYLERFLEAEQSVSMDEMRELICDRKLFPCYFGSALRMEGVRELIDGITALIKVPEYEDEQGARVFKITRDDQGNRLTHMKVTGGTFRVRDLIGEEKINQIRLYSGTGYETVSETIPGMICAVTGLGETFPGQGLGCEAGTMKPVLAPVLNYQLILPDEVDPVKFLPSLRLLEEEDPELRIIWEEKLREIQLRVMGEIQIQILKRMIEKRFGITVSFGPGHIVYKETLTAPVEGVGHFEPLRHYAEVHLLMEPGEMGSGIRVESAVSEDDLALNWQRLIMTHVRETVHPGVLLGAAITDMKITVVGGRAHTKHTEGGDFRQATYRAIRNGLMQALAQNNMQLLEPYYRFRLELPTENIGRGMTDLEQRFAHFSMESGSRDGYSILTGSAPAEALQDYQKEVKAYTGGLGDLAVELLGYGPCHNMNTVLEASTYDPESDPRRSPDSVFCSHGAGVIIPWYEVPKHMHVDSGLGLLKAERVLEEQRELVQRQGGSVSPVWVGTEEIDAILHRTFDANKKAQVSGRKRWGRKSSGRSYRAEAESAKNGGGSLVGNPSAAKKSKTSVDGPEYLLVDGYNVIFAWKELNELARINIDSARDKLQDILCNYQAVRGCELIIVFDAYRVKGHDTEYYDYHNIHIVYTKEAETADQYIEHFAHEHRQKYRITVATSDGLEQIIIRGQGCLLISSRELEEEVRRAGRQNHEEYSDAQPGGKTYLLDGLDPEVLEQLRKDADGDS